MALRTSCPHCRSLVSVADPGAGPYATCPRCGGSITAVPDESNPYAPPAAIEGSDIDGSGEPLRVPASLLGKYALSLRILLSDLPLIWGLILTVWLPGNLLINYLTFSGALDDVKSPLKLTNMIEGLFGPIATGGVLYALARRMEGGRATYREALGVGLRRWGALFGTRFVTGLIILLGFLALVIPGILLSIRYALVDPVVVLEGVSGPPARRRSTALTQGRRWQIVWAGVLFFFPYALAAGGIGVLYQAFEPLQNLGASVALDCLVDLFPAVLVIVLFLVYWEAVGREAEEVRYPEETGDVA